MLTRRLVVYSPQDEFQFELSPNDVFSAKEVEEINGEHSITIVTTQHLEKEQRILTMDATEKWREYVIMGSDGQHDSNERPFGTYRGVWSIQHDFPLFGVDDVVGLDYPVTAAYALERILSNTARWSRGTVTRYYSAGANMTQINGWEALQLLLENWGGEIDVTITVSNEKVISRKVDLYEKLGNQTATRRFDYRHDLTSMRRKVDEMPVACRIRPYGKGEKTIDDIDVKITIEEVNDGKDYLQNDAMANQLRLPNGSGGWEYPTINVTESSIEDEEELLEWGLSVLEEYTTPKATYEASVSQFVAAGMGAEGVELGDKTQCVDREFDPDGGVRIESRIRKIENDLIDPTLTKLTLGDVTENYLLSVGSSINKINSSITDLTVGMNSTAEYLNNLLEHINEQINATGGYTYITRGQGLRTYDKAVTDPLVGAEADAVVEIKGGTIRIANSKTATGEWEWRTVFVSGHIAADVVTAANITTGFIGNRGGSYWDLDNDVLQIASTASIGTKTVTELLEAVRATITGVDTDIEYNQNQSRTNSPSQGDSGWSTTAPAWREGWYIWQRTKSVVTTEAGDSTSYSAPTCISGRDGAGVVVSSVSYGTSSSASTEPTNWSPTAPTSIAQGTWLWVLTTYSDNSTTTSKSYVGTNGTSVTITQIEYGTSTSASTEPSSWSTTSPTSLTNGTWLWVRTTYSNGSTAINKSYVGINGQNGVGITSIVEQYYLSTSSSSQTGGSWSDTQPTWASGKYIWTRSYITWDNGDTSTTTPILAGALNSANQTAKEAKDAASDAEKVATNYLTFSSTNGLDIGYSGTSAKTRINASGINIYDGSGASALFAGLSGSNSIVRVGKQTGSGNVVMSSEGYVDVHNGSTVMAHFGYGSGKNSSGGTSIAPYYDIGIRESGTTVGNYSMVEGYDCRATGYCSHAEGSGCQATAREAHAEGMLCKVSGEHSHAGGSNCQVTGDQSFAHGSSCYVWGDCAAAFGFSTRASSHSLALGSCNIGYDNSLIEAGNGLTSSRKNVMNLWDSGNLWISGSYSNSSDRRLKTHHAYLAEDAADFVRQLKPALFTKDGERHVGFYAQEVAEAEPEEWDTVTVTAQHTDESLDFDPLTLDYTALIAPLVAYAQSLEKRIDQQQKQIDEQGKLIRRLTERLDKLEA